MADIPKCIGTYPEEKEQDESDSKYYSVADKSLARQTCHCATFSDFKHNEGETKCLDCACKGEDKWELAIAEHKVEK